MNNHTLFLHTCDLLSNVLLSLRNDSYRHEQTNNTVFVSSLASVDPNLKSLVYGVGIEYGEVEDWDYVWAQYNTSQDPYEKVLYLSALARSRQHWILQRQVQLSWFTAIVWFPHVFRDQKFG